MFYFEGFSDRNMQSSFKKIFGWYGELVRHYEVSLPLMLHDILDMNIYSDTLHLSDIPLNCDLVAELDIITGFDLITKFPEVSIEHLQRMRLANRGNFLFRTLDPSCTCICSNDETILSWTCHVSCFLNFEHTSVLFCFEQH